MTSVHLYAFVCGRHTVPASFMLGGSSQGSITIPVVGFLVSHSRGLFVFDTGFNRRVHQDLRSYFPVDALESRDFHFTPADEMPAQMRLAGFDPEAVRLLSNSHLHYDHSGGNALFARARVLVQRAEWEAANAAKEDVTGYRPTDFQTGHDMQVLDGQHDVFGDGTVVLFPTPGHTAGHQSLRVQCPDGVAVVTGDACYMTATLEEGALPAGVPTANSDEFLTSVERLRSMKQQGDVLFVSHDPNFWAAQPLAPTPLLG